MASIPGPRETLVSSVHGSAALSDTEHPVCISRHGRGAIITPPAPLTQASSLPPAQAGEPLSKRRPIVGKIHYSLPTLRGPQEETILGKLTGLDIVSTALELSVSPYGGEEDSAGQINQGSNIKNLTPQQLQELSRIIRVDLYAGREVLGSWGESAGAAGDQQQPLPANHDFRIHIISSIHGESDNQFNENPNGLGVTLTIEFGGERPSLMVSSVALVQDIVGRGFARS